MNVYLEVYKYVPDFTRQLMFVILFINRSLVKSVVVFAVGVYIARECKGLDLMSPVTQ